jgi:hypothetical protein
LIKIIDNFLSPQAYNDLIIQIACGPFMDEVNESDAVTYPLICKYVPESVTEEISNYIDGEFIEFLRASPKGVHCPHPTHNDASMGRVSVMIYTSTIGGTAIMRHKETGIMCAPDSQDFVDAIKFDCGNIESWEIMELAEAKPNRAAIFDARLMHAAIPFGGEGEGVKARTVYTRFIR